MAAPGDNSVESVRVFKASRARLFRAWSDPAQLARWWGPKGFTNTFHEFEFKAQGNWRFTMHAPNGAGFENTCVFLEIVPNERVVLRHDLPVHVFIATTTFEDAGDGSTRVRFRMDFEAPGEVAKIGKFIEQANEENFDRLEDVIRA